MAASSPMADNESFLVDVLTPAAEDYANARSDRLRRAYVAATTSASPPAAASSARAGKKPRRKGGNAAWWKRHPALVDTQPFYTEFGRVQTFTSAQPHREPSGHRVRRS